MTDEIKNNPANNMELWELVYNTDPKQVKPITGKSYQGNSPKPYYIVRKATELFGPIGIGWGYEVVEERYIETVIESIQTLGNGQSFVIKQTNINHTAKISFWYKWNGVKSEPIQQTGGTTVAYKTSTGKQIFDEDASKKSITDALIKCMSYLGFAGDIFEGRWDDSKYFQENMQNFSKKEQEEQQAKQQEQEARYQEQQRLEFNAKVDQTLKEINAAESTETLKAILANWHGYKGQPIYDTIKKQIIAKSDMEGWSK